MELPTQDVLNRDRERMHIELTFRDWKTHLGVRGLRLEVDAAPRLGRLLLVLSIAYILVVLHRLGRDRSARSRPFRGSPLEPATWNTSAAGRSLDGILALSLGRFADLVRRGLDRLLGANLRPSGTCFTLVDPPAAAG